MKKLQIEVGKNFAFNTLEQRARFAKFVAGIFAAGAPHQGIPYTPTDTEKDRWIVDQGNDWRVIFDENNPCRVGLWMRYHDDAVLETATRFIAWLYGRSKVVEAA